MRCPGCGAEVPEVEELRANHLYVGAAPGCWAAYTELVGRQMADPGLFESRMLSVDAYMAQHPGVPGRQSSQSVWSHLVGLCLSLEYGYDGVASARAKARLLSREATFEWLGPAASLGDLTVLDMFATTAPPEHRAAVSHWAESVWQAWEPHHDAIRQRVAELRNSGPSTRRRMGPRD